VGKNLDAIDAEFRAVGLEPLDPYTRCTEERRCRCTKCGTTRWVKLTNLRNGGIACRWCHGWAKWAPWAGPARVRAATWRPLGTAEESLSWLAHADLAPLTPVGDLYQPVGAVCLVCGETLVTVPERIKSSRGRPGWFSCERCAADRKRRIRADAPQLFEENGLQLLSPCRGEYVPQRARCMTCGVERRVSYNDLRKGSAGECWTCKTGIRPDEPHRVYHFHFPSLGVMKIGITHNRDDRRLDEHAIQGGRVVATVVVPNRWAARRVERFIRSLCGPWAASGVGPSDFPQGGWTETWRDDAPALDLEAAAAAVLNAGRIRDVAGESGHTEPPLADRQPPR